ncbi:MAG: TetR/AcrR family transcriptional regulator [Melioribacter sp.]|nr:TetR/AcrR family transcriptional regulator [Melioribacter sp.]
MARISTEERQRIIVDEAIRIIHESGYQSFSIRELSKRVGISEPAIYRHFLNKEDIVLGILGRFNEFDQHLFNNINEKETPKERIQSFVKFHFDFLENHPEMTSIIFAEDMFNQSKIIKEKMMQIIIKRKGVIKGIVEEAKQKKQIVDIESSELLTVILGYIRLVVLEWRLSNFTFSLSERGKKTVDTLEKLLIMKP